MLISQIMALYYEAEKIIRSPFHDGGLKTKIFSGTYARISPMQLYATITETVKWSPVLKEVVENSGLLEHERKLSPEISLLLVHDHLLSKKGIAASQTHPLRVSIEKHKSRLHSEFVKCRLRRKCHDNEELKKTLRNLNGDSTSSTSNSKNNNLLSTELIHPRWVRINALQSSLEEELQTTFSEHVKVSRLSDLVEGAGPPKIFLDPHISNLVAISPEENLSKSAAYLKGHLIFQEKASCFPATLLDPNIHDDVILDACAAPGNKTTHVASLCYEAGNNQPRILACERDKARAGTLVEMLKIAGAESKVQVFAGQDFLRTQPFKSPWRDVQAILLDPSCSGSGIIGREDRLQISLPQRRVASSANGKSKKRKLNATSQGERKEMADPTAEADSIPTTDEIDPQRLANLASFQLKLLTHAFTFPAARKIVYSTCSIHSGENEEVVSHAVLSQVYKEHGWQILRREYQVPTMRSWKLRGTEKPCVDILDDPSLSKEVAEACIRCDKHDENGTMGFFVAGFVKNIPQAEAATTSADDSASEWNGFSDDES